MWIWSRTILNSLCKQICVQWITNPKVKTWEQVRDPGSSVWPYRQGILGEGQTVSSQLPGTFLDTSIWWRRFTWLISMWSCVSPPYVHRTPELVSAQSRFPLSIHQWARFWFGFSVTGHWGGVLKVFSHLNNSRSLKEAVSCLHITDGTDLQVT